MAETNDYTLDEILDTVKELPSDTKVRHWLFNTDKNTYYVAVYYFFSRLGWQWSFFPCNKKGQRKGTQIAGWPGFKSKDPIENVEIFIEEHLKLQFEPLDEADLLEAQIEAEIAAEEAAADNETDGESKE